MKKILFVFIILFFNHAIGKEIICEKYFRTLEGTTGDLSLSITLPEDDILMEFIYKKNSDNVWTINELKLPNNINKIIENKFNKIFSNLKKTKKHKGNFTLKDFYNIYGFELNYVRYQNMNTNDILSYVNQMSRKEINEYIDQEILLQKSFKQQISDIYENLRDEVREKINNDGYYVKFDRSSNKNGKLILSNNSPEFEGTIFDEGVKSIISENESQLNKSTTEFFGVRGDTIYKVIYEGNCGNQTDAIINKNNNGDISSKLKKLKLLFEDELITQEEYDAKRKEILDDM